MVDMFLDQDGRVRVRLLDLVPGMSCAAYSQWQKACNEAFRNGVVVATGNPFRDYNHAIDDAFAVLAAFDMVGLDIQTVD